MTKEKYTLAETLEHFLGQKQDHVLKCTVINGNISVDFDGSVPFLLFNALTTALQNGYTMTQIKEILAMANKFAKYKK